MERAGRYIKSVRDELYASSNSKTLLLLLESLEPTPSTNVKVQVVRSLVVSVLALAVDFSTLILFKEVVGLHYLVAATLSFSLGVVVNYTLSVRWVFATRKLANRHAEFIIFFVICAIGLGLNLIIMGGMVQGFAVDYRLAKAVSTVIVFFWNFIARKLILY